MELTKEFIEEHKLEETQVEAIKNHIDNEVVPTLKKEYDTKANDNAEGILDGAAKYAREKLGIELQREKGEKLGDYLTRIADAGLTSKTEALKKREAELEDKLKNFKGSDEVKQQLEAEKKKTDDLLKKVAELEPLKGLDEKLKEKDQELSGLKLSVAFANNKPSFPDTVNKYEAQAKWDEFKGRVLEKYTIEIEEGVAYGVDKENVHRPKVKLSELVEKDEDIKELLKGRQQKGTGGKPIDMMDVDGLPFRVPVNGSSEELTKIVREHLIKELGSITHKDYAKKFQELYTKAKTAK